MPEVPLRCVFDRVSTGGCDLVEVPIYRTFIEYNDMTGSYLCSNHSFPTKIKVGLRSMQLQVTRSIRCICAPDLEAILHSCCSLKDGFVDA
jgi:hypothetical protein